MNKMNTINTFRGFGAYSVSPTHGEKKAERERIHRCSKKGILKSHIEAVFERINQKPSPQQALQRGKLWNSAEIQVEMDLS